MSKLGFENVQELQKLQDKFSKITKLFLYCVDAEGNPLTEISGEKHGISMLFTKIRKKYFENIFRELTESTAEEQIVEDTEIPGVKVAAQSIRQEGRIVSVWMLFAMIDEEPNQLSEWENYTVTEDELYDALDFLRILSYKILQLGKQQEIQADIENENTVPSSMHALMEIVQLLESEDETELAVRRILDIAGRFLQISSAQVFQVYGEQMNVMVEWLAEGAVSLFDKTRNIKTLPLLKGERLLTISSDTKLSVEASQLLEKLHVNATVIVPMNTEEGFYGYVCFNVCGKPRIWKTEELKFIKSTARIMQTILIRRSQRDSLKGSQLVLESVLNHAGSAICVRELESGRLLFANRIMRQIFHAELEQETFFDLLEDGAQEQENSFEVYHKGKNHWYDMYSTDVHWIDGSIAQLYVFYDITDKKIYQKQIEQQAYTDFLTGLYNRICCERDLAIQIDEAKRSGKQGAILYLDLDDFKHINDGLGHQYGDTLLKAISHSLCQIPEINNKCYRVGGDEFIVIIPVEHYSEFDRIAKEIKSIFDKPWSLRDRDYYCTMSMGVVFYPDAGDGVQELIKKADIAMFEAKRDGKNRVAFYSDAIESLSGKRLDMEKNMRDATVAGYREFEVFYQPIVALQGETGETICTGAEALIRWNSIELGFISPADFIPLAEYLGLINPIGNHVLMEACKECKRWNDAGYPHYKVNVNLSVVQLLQPDIVDVIDTALRQTGLKPENLTLEVTENLAINDMERMKDIMGSIRKLGARIALDDFGTGYSSLNHIRELPFDVIKIDQSFVKDLHEGSYSQAFIKMVTELAAAIDVNVCVEGVETEEQYDVIKKMAVSILQGYYFDKPLSRQAFEEAYMKPIAENKEGQNGCKKAARAQGERHAEKSLSQNGKSEISASTGQVSANRESEISVSADQVSEKEHAIFQKV